MATMEKPVSLLLCCIQRVRIRISCAFRVIYIIYKHSWTLMDSYVHLYNNYYIYGYMDKSTSPLFL